MSTPSNVVLFVIIFAAFCTSLFAQQAKSLPLDATVIETQDLGTNRKLILWMAAPQRHPNTSLNDFYTCPEQTRGSYYSGELNVTLVNSLTDDVINTLKVKGNEDSDEIDIPYLIRSGYYYSVSYGSPLVEGKPTIMTLKDYNGDGKAQEFALFDAEACMGLGTSLIGYSQKQDRVIQYPIRVKGPEGVSTRYWLDYLFSKPRIGPGLSRYQIDYRGRGGTLDKFTVSYDQKSEQFNASIIRQQ
jgi:hypothetical protein